jgi:phosphopantothenate synthetase
MTKAQAHFRLDPELLEAIKVRAEKESITITDLVTRFLKQGIGIETNNTIPAINQQEIEETVYQRISESISSKFNDLEAYVSNSISNKIYSLETDVFNRVSERVSLMIDDLEKRVSKRVSSQQHEKDKIVDIESIERISEETKHLETIKSAENVSNDVSQRYTKNQQQELAEITNASLFEANYKTSEAS